jgi:hypothetical protein
VFRLRWHLHPFVTSSGRCPTVQIVQTVAYLCLSCSLFFCWTLPEQTRGYHPDAAMPFLGARESPA